MKTLKMQKRLSAEVLKVGKGKVWFDPEKLEDIQNALTKNDIRELIKEKLIKAKKVKKRKKEKKVKKKRRRGPGKIKKKVGKRKQIYVKKIRKLRKFLAFLKKNKIITPKEWDKLRKHAKAGLFKSKKHLQIHIREVLSDEKREIGKALPRTVKRKVKKKTKKK